MSAPKLTESPVRWLMCRTGWCGGSVVTAIHTDGLIWCGWQCATCSAVKHAHPVPDYLQSGRAALAEGGEG